MDDDYQSFDSPSGDEGGGRRARWPVKLNIQTVATAILIVALIAVIYMFFAPPPEADTTLVLPTATSQAKALPGATGTGALAGSTPSVPAGAAALGGTGTPGPAGLAGVAALGTGSVPAVLTPGTPGAPVPAGAIATGGFARVGGTEGMGIRYRLGPGTDYLTLRIVMDGESLKVMGGPETASGETWWRLQDQYGNVGWAAQTYLQAAAAPASWAPPAASPTFSAQAGEQAVPAATP